MRHEKRLGPTSRLWERWYLVPADHPRVELRAVLRALDALDGEAVGLLLDLKGVSPRLARAVLDEVGDRRPLTVSTKSWWLLGRFARAGGIRTFRSAGNRAELALLSWVPSRVRPDGFALHRRLVTERRVSRLHRRVPLVWAWGAGDRVEADRLIAAGVDGLILDDVELIDALRRRRRPERPTQARA